MKKKSEAKAKRLTTACSCARTGVSAALSTVKSAKNGTYHHTEPDSTTIKGEVIKNDSSKDSER